MQDCKILIPYHSYIRELPAHALLGFDISKLSVPNQAIMVAANNNPSEQNINEMNKFLPEPIKEALADLCIKTPLSHVSLCIDTSLLLYSCFRQSMDTEPKAPALRYKYKKDLSDMLISLRRISRYSNVDHVTIDDDIYDNISKIFYSDDSWGKLMIQADVADSTSGKFFNLPSSALLLFGDVLESLMEYEYSFRSNKNE